MSTHTMCDTETLGTRPGYVVLSAAFVRFNDEQSTTLNLSVPDQQAAGLLIDPDTHAWWGTQDPAAWHAATCNPVPLLAALDHIDAWLAWASAGQDWLIWCHGASFDAPILEAVYRSVGRVAPWKFWNIRDTRTLYDLACINAKDFAVPPPHIALNDAIGQTRAANAALAVLARAHQVEGIRRYFHHPESGSVFHTDDGSRPSDGLVEELTGGEYTELQRRGLAA